MILDTCIVEELSSTKVNNAEVSKEKMEQFHSHKHMNQITTAYELNDTMNSEFALWNDQLHSLEKQSSDIQSEIEIKQAKNKDSDVSCSLQYQQQALQRQ